MSGTLAELSNRKDHVAVVFMSHGEGGRLLQVNDHGEFVERYDIPASQIAAARDAEVRHASRLLGFEPAYLYPAEAMADFGKTLSCAESMDHWDDKLPGGAGGILRRLVEDIRARRPRVVITHDPRDDSHYMDHGHNKALGTLVEMAARMAADPAVGTGSPYVVQELLSVAPVGEKADVTLAVDSAIRMKAIGQYPSQFRKDKIAELSQQKEERYVLRWRAVGVVVPPSGSILRDLVGGASTGS